MMASRTKVATLLWTLLALFIGRVVGQLIVLLYAPAFLPPMEAWYSGLMPYQYLLPVQIVIIAVFAKICLDVSKGVGFWAKPKPRLGLWLRNFGFVYFAGMIVRYVLRMIWYPEERWTGGTIPIVFHFVLATYFIILGYYHYRPRRTC